MHAMADEQKKDFWEELQSLDDTMKRKILIVATAIIMVVIVYFWLAYFNNLTAGVTQQPPVAVNMPAATAAPAATVSPVPAAPTALAPAGAPADTADMAAAAGTGNAPAGGGISAPSGPSVWQNMGSGLADIARAFAWIGRGITGMFQAPKQYTVQPY